MRHNEESWIVTKLLLDANHLHSTFILKYSILGSAEREALHEGREVKVGGRVKYVGFRRCLVHPSQLPKTS